MAFWPPQGRQAAQYAQSASEACRATCPLNMLLAFMSVQQRNGLWYSRVEGRKHQLSGVCSCVTTAMAEYTQNAEIEYTQDTEIEDKPMAEHTQDAEIEYTQDAEIEDK